jgi:lysophospholipid acyltransferase (LPLAT)-like uncharacterized protein
MLCAAAWLLGAYLRFALRTTRWTLDGAANLAPFIGERAVVAAFWHECLPLMPALWMQVRRQSPRRGGRVLVSRHRDGRFIGAIMAQFGIAAVFGSAAHVAGKAPKERGGAASLRALRGVLEAGQAVVMTPDGPRGPPRQAAPGVAHLAAASGAPVLPTAARLRRHVRLKTRDRRIVPLPFGRGVLVCLPPMHVTDAEPATLAAIGAALTAAAERAESLCR